MSIAVIGSINVDLFYKALKAPLTGETIEGDSYFIRHGGKGANQAVILRSLYENTYFLGALGSDAFSTLSLDNLKQKSLLISDIVQKDTQSGFALIKLKDNDNSITIFEGANGALNKEDVDRFFNKHPDLKWIVLQLEIPLKIVEYVIDLAFEKSIKIILNPAPMKALKRSVIEKCDYIIPNETEYDALFKDTSLKEDAIIQYKGKLIITLGDKGVLYYADNQVKHQKASAIKPLDTTGAGDSFIAGFASEIAKGNTIEKAIEKGQIVARETCLCEGAQCILDKN